MSKMREAYRSGVLFFAATSAQEDRLGTMLEDAGAFPLAVRTVAALIDGIDHYFPRLVLVAGSAIESESDLLMRTRNRPQSRSIPLHLYHDSENDLRQPASGDIQVDDVWSYSGLLSGLPLLVDRSLYPPIQYVKGWDEPLSIHARRGVEEFNRRDYFEQHEYFELAWRDEPRAIRRLYQGILQIGVAFLQIERGNRRGSLKMFRRGLPRLRDLPPICQGLDLATFRNCAEEIYIDLSVAGVHGIAQVDPLRFPILKLDTITVGRTYHDG